MPHYRLAQRAGNETEWKAAELLANVGKYMTCAHFTDMFSLENPLPRPLVHRRGLPSLGQAANAKMSWDWIEPWDWIALYGRAIICIARC